MLTFVNKLDLPARDPLDLLDEIERVLGVAAAPMNWPIGTGDRFRGVYDLQQQRGAVLRARRPRGDRRAPVAVTSADDPQLVELHRRGTPHRSSSKACTCSRPPARASISTPTVRRSQTPVFFG